MGMQFLNTPVEGGRPPVAAIARICLPTQGAQEWYAAGLPEEP